jgi:filamentous hemagglutinin family protein
VAVPALSVQRDRLLEYDLARAVSQVLQTTKPNNVVNWQSFNIGSESTVKIGQSAGPSAVLLNNIVGRSPNPTVIDGILKNIEGQSSGRVYFYDPAGFVFGAGASVNLNSMIASSLRFDEARLKAGGLLMPGTDAALRAAGCTEVSINID